MVFFNHYIQDLRPIQIMNQQRYSMSVQLVFTGCKHFNTGNRYSLMTSVSYYQPFSWMRFTDQSSSISITYSQLLSTCRCSIVFQSLDLFNTSVMDRSKAVTSCNYVCRIFCMITVFTSNADNLILARQAQLLCHMQTSLIRVRRRVTRRLTRVQAV